MSHASATILGHLGRDPETRTAGDGTVTTLSVAVSRRGSDKQTVTTWWKVSVWGKSGETASKHLRKGAQVIATGWPELEEWTDADGVKRGTARLRNATWAFAGERRSDGDSPTPAPTATTTAPAAAGDEPPF
jgi:single-strand DNA-binding protein